MLSCVLSTNHWQYGGRGEEANQEEEENDACKISKRSMDDQDYTSTCINLKVTVWMI